MGDPLGPLSVLPQGETPERQEGGVLAEEVQALRRAQVERLEERCQHVHPQDHRRQLPWSGLPGALRVFQTKQRGHEAYWGLVRKPQEDRPQQRLGLVLQLEGGNLIHLPLRVRRHRGEKADSLQYLKQQNGWQSLRVLNANHTMLSLTETPIKEQVNSPGFPKLRELYIAVDSRGYYDGMDDSQVERILKKSDDLRHLDLRNCQNVTETCLIRLPTWDLEKLIVSGCSAVSSSDSLELMVSKWRKLKELD